MRTIYIITYVEKVIARWREGYGTVVPPELKIGRGHLWRCTQPWDMTLRASIG